MLNEEETFDEYEEMQETLNELSEYYSSATGRNIALGVDRDLDLWLESSRTNGKEYFDSISGIEERLRSLYSDFVSDEFGEFETF